MGGRINSRHCPELLAQEVMDIQKKIPIVLINGSLPGHPCHRVKTDEYAGTQLIMQHLIDRGHRSIGFLAEALKRQQRWKSCKPTKAR